jgi:hypothetical protein
MKSISKAVLITGLLALGGASVVRAQQAERMVQFHAPYAFQVEGTKLPAGDYTLLEQSGWVQIQSKAGQNKLQVLTIPVVSKNQKPAEGSRVVFHNYSGHVFLAEIWAAGQEKGRELIESREEEQLAKREKMAVLTVPSHSVSAR